MKVHRVELLIVDHDDIGANEVETVLENTKYPNHCMAPRVVTVDTAEIDWSDDHPLNTAMDGEFPNKAYLKLFPGAAVEANGWALFRSLSTILTDGNAATWEDLMDAAMALRERRDA